MKKLISLISLIFCAFLSYGQIPNKATVSNPQTQYHIPNMFADLAAKLPIVDTTNNKATPYTGALTILPSDTLDKSVTPPIYMTNGSFWSRIGGSGSGVDSTTYSNGNLCFWRGGFSTCYPLNRYYDSTGYNNDSTYYYHYNNGNFVDSVWIPHTRIFVRSTAGLEDTTANGFPAVILSAQDHYVTADSLYYVTLNPDGSIKDSTKWVGLVASSTGTLSVRRTVANMRLLTGVSASVVYQTIDYGSGFWEYDAADDTSADNTGTILITADGKRLKRIYEGAVNAAWFGAVKNEDAADILSDMILSNHFSKIHLPTGDTFYLSHPIGINPDTYIDGVNAVENLTLEGDGKDGTGATLIYTGAPTQSIFGISLRGKLRLSNIVIDGANIAVEGIRLRALSNTIPSSLSIENCVIKNFYSESTASFSAPTGLYITGNYSDITFYHDSIYNVIAGGTVLNDPAQAVNALLIKRGAGGIGYASSINIMYCSIGNVYGTDTTKSENQEAVYLQAPIVDSADYSIYIANNHFFNSRTRFLKLQTLNNVVIGNQFIIDNLFTGLVAPLLVNTISIDPQYGDIIAENNEFIYKGYSHKTVITSISRDTIGKRFVFNNNRISAHGDSIQIKSIIFSNNTGTSFRMNPISASNNTVDADSVAYFTQVWTDGDHPGNQVFLNNNRINSLSRALVYTRFSSSASAGLVKVYASHNVNKYGTVPVTIHDVYIKDTTVSFGNEGFVDNFNVVRKDVNQTITGDNLLTGGNTFTGSNTFSGTITKVGGGGTLNFFDGGGVARNPDLMLSKTSQYALMGVGVNDGVNNRGIGFIVDDANGVQGIVTRYSNNAIPITFTHNLAERMRISNNGSVGIATTNSDSTLNLGGSAKITGGVRLTGLPYSTSSTDSLLVRTTNGTVAYTKQSALATAAGTGIIVGNAATIGRSGSGFAVLGSNVALTNSNNVYNYQQTGVANLIDFTSGNIRLNTAASGTAGNPITFSTKLFIDATTGNVGILDINPAAAFVVGIGDLFQVTSAGAIAAVVGVTSSDNLVINTAGKGLQLKSGTNQRAGNATLVAGTVTVANTTVTANTLVNLTKKTNGGTIGSITYTLSAGASFTITSDNALDTSTYTYLLTELN